jgi:hypothetical protein
MGEAAAARAQGKHGMAAAIAILQRALDTAQAIRQGAPAIRQQAPK